jgi:hypothetical protein
MQKNILTGILGDEAEPLFIVEPLYFSTCHSQSLVARPGQKPIQTGQNPATFMNCFLQNTQASM